MAKVEELLNSPALKQKVEMNSRYSKDIRYEFDYLRYGPDRIESMLQQRMKEASKRIDPAKDTTDNVFKQKTSKDIKAQRKSKSKQRGFDDKNNSLENQDVQQVNADNDITDLSLKKLPTLSPYPKGSVYSTPKSIKSSKRGNQSLSRNKHLSISMPSLPNLSKANTSKFKPFVVEGNFKYLKSINPVQMDKVIKIFDKIDENNDNTDSNKDVKEVKQKKKNGKNTSSDNINDTINEIIQKCNKVEEENKYMKSGYVYSRSNDLHRFQTQFNRIHRQLYGPSDEELYAFMKLNNPKLKLKIDEDFLRSDDRQNDHKILMENEKDSASYKVSYDYSRYLKKRAAKLHERIRRKRVLRTLDHNHSTNKQE